MDECLIYHRSNQNYQQLVQFGTCKYEKAVRQINQIKRYHFILSCKIYIGKRFIYF